VGLKTKYRALLVKAISGAFLVLTIVGGNAVAQSTESGFDRGLYFGGVMGKTDLSDDRLSILVRPFIRHQLFSKMDGEFSIGIGLLNSTEYRTRIVPVDYRLQYFPFRNLAAGYRSAVRSNDIFLYAGAGALNFHHARILRPNDPLTEHAGKTISNSEHWSFGKNWSAQAPVGIGTKVWLDQGTALLLTAGYVFTSSEALSAVPSAKSDGYWNVSVGLSMRSLFRPKPEPMPEPIYPVTPPVAVVVEPVIEEPVVVEPEIEIVEEVRPVIILPSMVNFDLLAFNLDEAADATLQVVRQYLDVNNEKGLVLRGHTDISGTDQLNTVLGYQRAWEVKSRLINAGVSPDRVVITSLSFKEPLASNDTEEGRRQNRRVEFDGVGLEELVEYKPAIDVASEVSLASSVNMLMPEVGVRFSHSPFRYEVNSVDFTNEIRNELIALLVALERESDVQIAVVGYSDRLPNQGVNELTSMARATKIKEFLVDRGIHSSRISTWNENNWEHMVPSVAGRILIIRTQ
jgi:outer membrane protein OmpA-like peptidoglycan-associated protein